MSELDSASSDVQMDSQHHRRSLPYLILQGFCRLWTTLLFDLKVYGAKNVPREGSVLVIANHQSYLDPVLLAVKLHRPMSYLAKSELFNNRFFSWLIRSLNAFPVKQGAGDVGAMKEAIRRLKEGHALAIFPEGSRSFDGKMNVVQPGTALVIRRANVPVVPVVIDGAYDAWPRKDKWFRPKPVRVMYGTSMEFRGMKSDEITSTIAETFEKMLGDLRAKTAGGFA